MSALKSILRFSQPKNLASSKRVNQKQLTMSQTDIKYEISGMQAMEDIDKDMSFKDSSPPSIDSLKKAEKAEFTVNS